MHFSGYEGEWRWPHFTAQRLSCSCCGGLYVDEYSLDRLEDLRVTWANPIILTCGHRCAKNNARVGGVPGSQHLKLAFDCAIPAADQKAFAALARAKGFTGIIRYPKRNFVHLDCRKTPYEGEVVS
ncbi:MAG: D-Ala-D-Ala carboxypeptidase family metallohydrolase [Desulfovibrionaceae bacterium]|nr:D-Ala-D-Ala carboxypeptidase family metallohydrolase [Desulfovibrionaceae bacterium]